MSDTRQPPFAPAPDSPLKEAMRAERDALAAPVPLADGAAAFSALLKWVRRMVDAGQVAEINVGTDQERTGVTIIWPGTSPVAVVHPAFARDAVAALGVGGIPVCVLGMISRDGSADNAVAVLLRPDRLAAAKADPSPKIALAQ